MKKPTTKPPPYRPPTAPALPPPGEPPADLPAIEAQLWRRIVGDYGIDDPAGLALLEVACRNLQLARECRAAVARDGLQIEARAHPLLGPLDQAEKRSLAALKALNLDLEPLRDGPGRPPGR